MELRPAGPAKKLAKVAGIVSSGLEKTRALKVTPTASAMNTINGHRKKEHSRRGITREPVSAGKFHRFESGFGELQSN